MTIRLKILIFIILSTGLVFILSIGFVNYRYWEYSVKTARQIADLYSRQSAITAQNILTSDLKTVETLNDIFKSYYLFDKNQRNKFYNQILKDVLENNPEYLATWVSWELSSIDPQWNLPYGRERSIAFLSNGVVKITIDSVNLDGDVPGSYYYLMKTNLEKNLLSNPYFFSYTKDTSSSFLETSLGKGIFIGDKFVGAVGIDVSLERFNKIIEEIKPFEGSKIIIISNDGTIVGYNDMHFVGKKISNVFPEFSQYKVTENIKNGVSFSFNLTNNLEQEYISFYPIKIEGSTMPWSVGFIVSDKVLTQGIMDNLKILLVISLISLIVIALIIWSVLSIIVRPIEKMTKSLEALSKGVISDNLKINYNTKDELGRMSIATNILIESLHKTQKFAIEIGKGNLGAQYEKLSDSDILGKSLIEMRDNLSIARIEEGKRDKETQKINWAQQGIQQINEILREYNDNLEILAREIVKFSVTYTGSIIGGFYLVETREDIDYVSLKASYAYDRFKELKSDFIIGEGLVGRAVKEKKHVIIEDLPEGYLFVRSGLGDKSPDNLIIIPLIFENIVLGAIELASFEKFLDYKVDFLLQIVIRITSSLSVMLKNIETSNLLKESQLQAATFEMKEKQFMRQRSKLNEKQKELDQKESQLGSIFTAMKILGLYMELDMNLNLIESNEFLINNLKLPKQDLLGKNINDLTQTAKGTKVWYDKFWEDIKSGEVRKKQTTYEWQDRIVTVNETFFKFKDKNGDKIIVIGL